MRPDTARAIAAIEIPWDDLREFGERHPVPADHPRADRLTADSFAYMVTAHLCAITHAADTGRGVIGLVSV